MSTQSFEPKPAPPAGLVQIGSGIEDVIRKRLAEERARLKNIAERRPADERPVLVSAITGQGIDDLNAAIEARLAAGRVLIELELDPADGAGLSWLYRHTEVIHKSVDEKSGRTALTVRAAPDRADEVRTRFAHSLSTARQ